MKFFAILSSIFFAFSPTFTPISSFALIGEDCLLYADESAIVSVCSLPSSYFVEIIEEQDSVYKVSYLDIDGYVKAESVTIVDYLPLNKYPTSLSCSLSNDGNTITMRSSPFIKDDNVITRLESEEIVEYYGSKKGDSQIEILGDEWYYIKDKNGNFGYVYNLYLTPPTFPKNDYLATEKDNTSLSSSLSLSSMQSGIVIALLSLLFVILVYFCTRPKSQRD